MKHFGKIYKCSCAGECSALEWRYADWDEKDKSIELCIWKKWPEAKSFFDRLRLSWEMLTKGTLYTDEIIFDKETATELVYDLKGWLDEE